MNIDDLISRWRKLSGEKGQWHQHWEDLARVMLPRRMGFTTTTIPGERRTDDIFDGTPMQAARGLANAIGGFMRPSGLPDFEMAADNDELNGSYEVQDWMADSKERQIKAFNNPKARYRQVSGEFDLDWVVFGTAIEYVGENKARSRLMFQSLHLKDATPTFDEEGNGDGLFHHRRHWTARQLAQRFGEQALSERTRQALKDNPDKQVEVLHAVLPRTDFKEGALLARNMPIADLWIEIEAKHQLAVGGFHEFPFVIGRADSSSGEDYGRSPGMIALPDADTLQAMGETVLIAGQRAADPPLFAPNDGSFNAVHTFPGGLSYYDVETATAMRGNPFFALDSGTNLPITRDMQADTRESVYAAFFRNVFNLPVDGPQMTATEINMRKEEFMREIGPLFGRYETEKSAPEIERAFMILLRANAFLPIPKALQGQNISFQYQSPIKKIRQQIEAATARMWAMEMLELGQVKPDAADLVNIDGLGRFSASALGIPNQIVNSPDLVEQMRAQRADALVQSQKMEGLTNIVNVAKTGAEAISKIQPKNTAAAQ